ncbi:MAG TPA: hypothetical protein VHT95_11755 [Vicinamibacterales bacterium]|nr:hypothetical protein [Vicinamibacterales bacterium]
MTTKNKAQGQQRSPREPVAVRYLRTLQFLLIVILIGFGVAPQPHAQAPRQPATVFR